MVSAGPLRLDVAESWLRSAAAGVGLEQAGTAITLADDDLAELRQAHPLSAVLPLLDDVLGNAAASCDAIMAVSDAAGQLLWVQGSHQALRRAESIGFVPGASWAERDAGTNAPGLVIATDAAAEITRAEHFRHDVQAWSCVAAPIHDPDSHQLLGVLDITGGAEIEVPQTMAMVRAAARLAEAELARTARADHSPLRCIDSSDLVWPSERHTIHSVSALGRSEALINGHARGSTPIRLSPRHSEIVVLLLDHPSGLSGQELAVKLYENEVSATTLRVELGRLRNLLGPGLSSRPYRLTPAASDWAQVEALVAAGDLSAALRAYAGPLLPRSDAPAIVELRQRVHTGLRKAVLKSGQADLMLRWTRSSWAADDIDAWLALKSALRGQATVQAMVEAQLDRLDGGLRLRR